MKLVVLFIVNQVLFAKHILYSLTIIEHPLRPLAHYPLDSRQHSRNMIIQKQYILCPELCEDTAQTPNVNFLIVSNSQNNFRCAITPRLNILSKIIVKKARVSQIYHLNHDGVIGFYEYVFRFQVCMNNLKFVKSFQCGEDLSCYFFDHGQRKKGLIFLIGDVKVVFHQICFDKEMFPVIENIFEFYQVFLIWITVCVDISQDFYLVQSLVKEILATVTVDNHFQAGQFIFNQICDLQNLSKHTFSQDTLLSISPCQNTSILQSYLFGIFIPCFLPVEDDFDFESIIDNSSKLNGILGFGAIWEGNILRKFAISLLFFSRVLFGFNLVLRIFLNSPFGITIFLSQFCTPIEKLALSKRILKIPQILIISILINDTLFLIQFLQDQARLTKNAASRLLVNINMANQIMGLIIHGIIIDIGNFSKLQLIFELK